MRRFKACCSKQWAVQPPIRPMAKVGVKRAVGSPRAFRAVGNANNKNPIPLIIPCHRVIGSNGKLVGFGGGIWRKEWLLEHEQSPLL